MWDLGWRIISVVCVVGAATIGAQARSITPDRQAEQGRPAPAESTRPASDQQRLNDLIALIEGPNSAQARRTGARELIRQGGPQASTYLIAILCAQNRQAKVAVASALAEYPGLVVADYTEPLLVMLADADSDVRRVAVLALAGSRDETVIPRLRELAVDTGQTTDARQAAIEALAMIPHREAVAVLMELVAGRESPIAERALEGLERATSQDFHEDQDAALEWWDEVREAGPADWQRWQIERLVCESRAKEQRIEELEQRLTNALRENYVRTAEAQRPALLQAYLTDGSAAVRTLGLTLVQSKLAEGKTLAPETAAGTRELLAAAEPSVRASAIRSVATLRDPADGERFERLLASEHHPTVRAALANGLGYVGSASAASALIQLLESTDRSAASEAVTALGRLSERGVLDKQARDSVASALLARMRATAREDYTMRERLLWAMSRIGDRRFAPEFIAALYTPEDAAVRLAAVRGMAVLVDPTTARVNGQTSQPASRATSGPAGGRHPSSLELVDALATATADPDAGVRRAAVEAVAQFGTSDAHVEALFDRLSPDREPEEGIRVTAWRGATRIISGRPVTAIQAWLDRLPCEEAVRTQRAVELLQAAEKNLESRPEARGELGWVRARLAGCRAAMGQLDQSVSTYLTALEDLHAAGSPELAPVALALLRLALVNDRYDEQIAAAMVHCDPALDGRALWEGVRDEIERRLQPDDIDSAIAMLIALQTNPPASMPADSQEALDQTLARARHVRVEKDTVLVNGALQSLAEDSDDERARQTIIQLGARALPALRDALRSALQAEQPDADRIQLLYDLVKSLAPDWPGFPANAALEEKLTSLDQIDT